MKKLLLFCLILGLAIVSTNSTYAQGQNAFGIEAGVNFAKINGDDVDSDNVDSRTGFFAGVFYQHPLSNGSFYLQPELLYTQKGYEVGEATVKLDYISFDALLSYYFGGSGSITPFVKVGPYIAVNINAKQEIDGEEEDGDEFIKDTDIGVLARAGIRVKQFEVGARFSQGVTTIFEDDAGFDKAKNTLFGFFVGVLL